MGKGPGFVLGLSGDGRAVEILAQRFLAFAHAVRHRKLARDSVAN